MIDCAERAGSRQATRRAGAKRKCSICKRPAVGWTAVNAWCGEACALEIVERARRKAQAKAERERKAKRKADKERTKPTAKIRQEAQAAFNAWVRERDAGLPCVSCGRPNDGLHQRHAGHYRSVGAHPELRFDPANCHAQCSQCNNYLSGNLIAYRAELTNRIGIGEVVRLETSTGPAKYTRDDLLAIKARYQHDLRELRRSKDVCPVH